MKNILNLLLVYVLFSCTNDSEYVRFETAQPADIKAMTSFGGKIKGEYINCNNSTDRLMVTDQEILNTRKIAFKTHRNDLEFDSTVTVNKDIDEELIKLFHNEGYEIEIDGDTVMAAIHDTTTIFNISENQLLKKFKGNYFLNTKTGEASWKVQKVNLSKDTLLIGEISPSDTLLRFDFVVKQQTLNEHDSTTTTKYSINPTKKELKGLMKPNAFDRCKCYYKAQ